MIDTVGATASLPPRCRAKAMSSKATCPDSSRAAIAAFTDAWWPSLVQRTSKRRAMSPCGGSSRAVAPAASITSRRVSPSASGDTVPSTVTRRAQPGLGSWVRRDGLSVVDTGCSSLSCRAGGEGVSPSTAGSAGGWTVAVCSVLEHCPRRPRTTNPCECCCGYALARHVVGCESSCGGHGGARARRQHGTPVPRRRAPFAQSAGVCSGRAWSSAGPTITRNSSSLA